MREEFFESNKCLTLPLEMFREYIGKDLEFVVEIEDLKLREEDDRESVESNVEKDMEEK